MPFYFLFLEDGPSYTQRHLTAIPESTGISSFFFLFLYSFLSLSIFLSLSFYISFLESLYECAVLQIILLYILFTAPSSAIGSETDLRAGVVSSILAGPILSWRLIMKYFLWSFSVISYKGKYVLKVLVNRLVKLAKEKVWLG